MKKIISLVFACAVALTMQAQGQGTTAQASGVKRPKLVVGLVVDQMRWDYLYYYYDQFGEGGLKRLVDEGFSYENTMINYVPTVTAIGHSSIYTGSVPALTGIAGNNFMLNGKWVTSVTDTTVQAVGSKSKEGQASPRNLLASGLGDVLKIATDYQAKVIGVALKDRAAILPAGHGANAAYWWDTSAGHFISSTYYMDQLPEWVKQVNKEVQTKPKTDVKTSVPGVTKTFQMAEAAIAGEGLGQDDVTDLLAISVSSTDAIGHTFGTRGQENHDVYMELDRQVAGLLTYLDAKVGKGNYLLFLSADHGACHNHNLMKQHKLQAGGISFGQECAPVINKVGAAMGIEKLFMAENAGRIYLNHEAIAKSGKKLSDVKAAVCEALEQSDSILYCVDYDNVLTRSIPQPIREMIVNGYNKKRSGDLYYVAKAGWETTDGRPEYIGTTHGMWNPYDAHIPFVLYGWHVEHGQSTAEAHITDIAPTVCAMLHIQMPNSAVGRSMR